MSTLRFGYPSIVKLEGNELFAVFRCVEDAVSCIRYFVSATPTASSRQRYGLGC